ncbi:alpha/beta hydrolase fold domain-containing protein [Brevibacterium linens]|uniref:alpha/beta hydrolase fold domain-containing protein n=1 Tax=Brevibacterium linens TaxID=1703 RepID=UPI001F4946E6|nr:alpha/beta hydrolase fold domain-containing protein [Brevibacterium linens]
MKLVGEASAGATCTAIPADILTGMSDQMRAVLELQAARAADCAQAGLRAVKDDMDPETARLTANRAEYCAERSYWNEGGPTMARTDDGHIRAAEVDVPIRIHRPLAEAVLPGIVFLHGGGFTVGNLDTHDRIMRVLAEASGSAVIGVDYSLSPEAKFPQALHECAGIVDHLAAHGVDFGVDGARLAVAGDSAGAGLTLGTALLLRDDPTADGARSSAFSSLRALISVYGSHGLVDSASRRLFGGEWDGMGANDLNNFRDDYFAVPEDEQSPFASHLTADLSGLPPVFVAGAGLDPLRDDSRALARSLARAGNDVEFEEYPNVLHSFLHFGRLVDETNKVLASAADFAADRIRR